MLADIAAVEPSVGERLREASDAVGFDLARIVRAGPAAELDKTETTQPALLAASFALYEVWIQRGGPTPAIVAGHSLGEYSALVAAGALGFADAARLVHARGKLMQSAVPAGDGAMTAILGLDEAQVAACCEAAEGVATPANHNGPGQVVIAGEARAVAAAAALCAEAGARRTVPLAVSVPSHCPLMVPASERLAGLLETTRFADARLPVVQNANAEAATDAPVLRANLLRQLISPVRWAASMETMAASGATTFVECGPGKVLAGLARRINRTWRVQAIGDQRGLNAALALVASTN